MSTTSGGKVYTATKSQVADASKLLKAIREDDLKAVTEVFNKYPKNKKMVTGRTTFVPRDHVYNELGSKAMAVMIKLKEFIK